MDKGPWDGYYKSVEGKPSSNYGRIVRTFKKAGVKRVLDLGCGNGRHTIPLARDGFSVYGFDKSRLAVSAAKKGLQSEKLKAKLIVWDMLKPFPYGDGFFDAVFASRVMYHTTSRNIKKTVNEVGRVLRKGGYIYFEGPTYKKVAISRLRLWHDINGVRMYSSVRKVEPGTYVTVYPGASERTLYHVFRSKDEVIRLFDGFKVLQLNFRGRTFRMLAKKRK